MFKALKILKIVALFLILSGFAGPTINHKMTDVLNNLSIASVNLIAEYSQQNNLLINEARALSKIISEYKISMKGSKSELSSSQIFCLWLHYGELYRKDAKQTDLGISNSRRILTSIKGHMNLLLKIHGNRNGKSI
ncbi:hypothetical protein MNBD_GAMMA12-499 [hydrothermal vent metagenome]|uniref:Uncharacterized protein n=1 Tax=hydrothermal vent metagenome TaxID=652676 RepID=A0A3B0YBU8_9ZZZZ